MKTAYRIIALLAIGGLLVLAAGAYALGIAGYERYTGYFAPVWDDTGKGVYYIQRDTSGFIWGAGWENFSPPASSYVVSDVFSLRRINAQNGVVEILQTWADSPLIERTVKHYRGRIFNTVSARIDPSTDAADFVVRLKIPTIPQSVIWALAGTWRHGAPSAARWEQKWQAPGGISDGIIHNGVEVLTVRGREAFPAAIVSVAADGNHKVLIHNDDFADLYPVGIPDKEIAERSWRPMIERVRTYLSTKAKLLANYKAAGLSEGDAMLKVSDDMEELGLTPKRPRILAKAVSSNPDNLKIFEIPPDYFTVGLFKDIAAAIAEPGKLVDTGTGSYFKYYDDDLGSKLKAWRHAGNDRFIVRTNGKSYLLEVRRFN